MNERDIRNSELKTQNSELLTHHFSSGISTGSSRGSQTPQNSARAVTIAFCAFFESRYSATICGISRTCSLQIARPQKIHAPCAGRSQCQQFMVGSLAIADCRLQIAD